MLSVAVQRRQGTFSLDVAFTTAHQRVVLFGPSGAGKTLTLLCLAGLLVPDHGRIDVDGTVLFDAAQRINVPPWRRRVGIVLQSYTLFPHLPVAGNVAYGLAPVWRGRERIRVETLLAAVGLSGYADRMPAQLSGGQRQRVALAQVLASDPRLLLFDEPFSAVDAPVRERLRRDLLGLLDAFRIPLVFVTHDFGEAYLLGQTIVIVAGGRVVQIGSPAEVAERPRTATVARLVGATNILRGRVVDVRGSDRTVRAGRLVVRAAAAATDGGGREAVTFCIRPERIHVVRSAAEGVTATVTRVLPRNDLTTVLLAVDDVTLEAAVQGTPPPVGSAVGLKIPDGAAYILDADEEADDEDAADTRHEASTGKRPQI
jgi:molybdate transport system ATP-binding protein